MSATSTSGAARIAAAFADPGKRAALMPYLMGGHPDLETSRACLEAAIDAGADLIELGIPSPNHFQTAPASHEAGPMRLGAGANRETGFRLCRGIAGRVPVLLM